MPMHRPQMLVAEGTVGALGPLGAMSSVTPNVGLVYKSSCRLLTMITRQCVLRQANVKKNNRVYRKSSNVCPYLQRQ